MIAKTLHIMVQILDRVFDSLSLGTLHLVLAKASQKLDIIHVYKLQGVFLKGSAKELPKVNMNFEGVAQ